jgi:hypothetical protein
MKMIKADSLPVLLGVIFCLALPGFIGVAQAHHAFAAEFDAKAPVLLRGKVTKVEWINPHAWIHMLVEDAGKPPQPWMVEGGTPNTLLRAGIDRNSLKPGEEIIVRGYQSKDKLCEPACKANGRDVTLANGQKLFMGSSGTGAPRDGSDPNEPPAK